MKIIRFALVDDKGERLGFPLRPIPLLIGRIGNNWNRNKNKSDTFARQVFDCKLGFLVLPVSYMHINV